MFACECRRKRMFPVIGQGTLPHTDILPLINPDGAVIGQEKRSIVYEQGLLHPVVHLLLFNLKGQLLVQRRGMNKAQSAGLLSQSVGGHVPFGLMPKEALFKEANEELGIIPLNIRLIGNYQYESSEGRNKERVHMFTGLCRGKVHPNHSEVFWAAFVKKEPLLGLFRQHPELFAPSFRRDLTEYYYI